MMVGDTSGFYREQVAKVAPLLAGAPTMEYCEVTVQGWRSTQRRVTSWTECVTTGIGNKEPKSEIRAGLEGEWNARTPAHSPSIAGIQRDNWTTGLAAVGKEDCMNGRVISADGVSIAYRVEGSGNPCLVFVHGWCCDKRYWEPQVLHFAQKYRVLAIDLAGHGESGLEREKWTMAAFGEDIATVVNHLSLEQVVLIGHSMGTAVVLEAAQRIAKGVLGIVGVDQFSDVNRRRLSASPDEVVAPFRLNFVEAARKFAASMFLKTSDAALTQRIVSDMSSAPATVGIGAGSEFVRYDLGQALERTNVPVHCISADCHPFDLEAARQHCSSFQVTFMSAVGHFVMLEDPAAFNGLLENIVQELAA